MYMIWLWLCNLKTEPSGKLLLGQENVQGAYMEHPIKWKHKEVIKDYQDPSKRMHNPTWMNSNCQRQDDLSLY